MYIYTIYIFIVQLEYLTESQFVQLKLLLSQKLYMWNRVWNMKINVGKTKVMHIGKEEKRIGIKLQMVVVDQVDSFK